MKQPPPGPLDDDYLADIKRQAEDRMAKEDWQAQLVMELARKHPRRMRRFMRDLKWIRRQARKRGHRWAGDDS